MDKSMAVYRLEPIYRHAFIHNFYRYIVGIYRYIGIQVATYIRSCFYPQFLLY